MSSERPRSVRALSSATPLDPPPDLDGVVAELRAVHRSVTVHDERRSTERVERDDEARRVDAGRSDERKRSGVAVAREHTQRGGGTIGDDDLRPDDGERRIAGVDETEQVPSPRRRREHLVADPSDQSTVGLHTDEGTSRDVDAVARAGVDDLDLALARSTTPPDAARRT